MKALKIPRQRHHHGCPTYVTCPNTGCILHGSEVMPELPACPRCGSRLVTVTVRGGQP